MSKWQDALETEAASNDRFEAALEALKVARKELRHAGLDDAADVIDDLVARLVADADGHNDPDSDDDDGLTDAEADAMTLASAGMGTDEDYAPEAEDFEDFMNHDMSMNG